MTDSLYGLMVIRPGSSKRAAAEFSVFRSLEKDEYHRFQQAVGRVSQYMRGSLQVYAETALAQFDANVEQIRKFLGSRLGTPVITQNAASWQVSIQCNALTFASSLHLYQEQVEDEAVRLYGKGSDKHKAVGDLISATYDASFDYRLTYRLRNVMVHHSLASVALELSSAEDTTPAGLLLHRHTVKVPLRRDVFLRAKKGVSRSILDSLEALEENPNLSGVFDRAMRALRALHSELAALANPHLADDLAAINELDAMFGDEQGDRALASLPGAIPDGPWRMPHTPVRKDVFDLARRSVQSPALDQGDDQGMTPDPACSWAEGRRGTSNDGGLTPVRLTWSAP